MPTGVSQNIMISLANATFSKVNGFLKALGRLGQVFGGNKTPCSLVGVCSTTAHAGVMFSQSHLPAWPQCPHWGVKDTALSGRQGALYEP